MRLSYEDGTPMTAEEFMALHEVGGMVLLCDDCVPADAVPSE